MDEKELKQLIEKGESQELEFKQKPSEDIGNSICSFANTNNGIVLVGVSDKGEITGCSEKHEQQIANITHTCKPSIYPKIEEAEIGNKLVFAVKVKKSGALHSCKNIAYERVGTHDKPLSPEEVIRHAKDTGKIRFDSAVCEGASLEDIDEEKVKWLLRKAKAERRFDVEPETPVKEALERLELMKKGRLTNAGILLFGKEPQKFFLQAETRCARFKGTEPLEFIDMKVFGGNIINQRDDAVEFVKEHIKLHAKIVETERVETWEYPIEAIREAVTNAICHRDYEISSNVQVRIFDERIEVWGCGPLPEPLTPEDLRKKHRSILRNRLIGKCFFLIKFVEEWGTGTNRMIKECLNHGLPEPLFEEITKSLVVTFRKYKISEDILEKLNERQKKAIEYLKTHKKITRSGYVKLIICSKRTAFRDLEELLKDKIIIRKGKGKQTYYELA